MNSATSSPPNRRLVSLETLIEDHELYSTNFQKITNKEADLIPFTWNRPQWKVAAAARWQIDRGLPVRLFILKSRQVGISTWVQSFMFHRCHLRQNRQALTLAHKADSAIKLFEMERRFYDNLPREGPISAAKRHFTRKLIQFSGTQSSTQVEVVGESGRGFTCHYLHLSEMAFYADAKTTMTAVKQAVPRRPDTAVFVESTPNGWGNEFHKGYMRAKRMEFRLNAQGQWISETLRPGKSEYIAVFIAWYDDPSCSEIPWFEESDLDDDERDLVSKYGVTLEQLAWRRLTLENECDGDLDVFMQEYPSDDVTCFLQSGRSAFDRDGIAYQLQAIPPAVDPSTLPAESEIEFDAPTKKMLVTPTKHGRLLVFEDPIPRHTYCIAADPSEGDRGSDRTPIVVLDQMTLSFPAIWYGCVPPDILARHGINLAQHYNQGVFGWEANNHGGAVRDEVLRIGYPNLYYRTASADSVAMRESDKLGYMQSIRSRIDAIHTARKYIREAPGHGWKPLRDPRVVPQLTSFVWDEGKPVAEEGAEDDFVLAMAIALMMHRGDTQNPLEPLSIAILQAAYNALDRDIGRPLDVVQMRALGVTCEDLERYDEYVEKREKLMKKKGLRKQN